MASARNGLKAGEFGDFQTPGPLARQVCKLLSDRGIAPGSVVEPTCGVGNFLFAVLDQFPMAARGLGVEINAAHVDRLAAALRTRPGANKVRVICQSVFDTDWAALLRDLPEPILVIGNPPWVTNSQLGARGGTNLPTKTNFQNHTGLDALTGKSNFDISEWMLITLMERLEGRRATVAMLCKTTIARKVFAHACQSAISLVDAEIRAIDAPTLFDAAVDACLLVCSLAPAHHNHDCRIYRHLGDEEPARVISYHADRLIADVAAYTRWKHLEGEEVYKWRSGVKHDCSRVMVLRKEGERYRNGLGELVDLEDDYLYPMLKSSELAHGCTREPSRWMLLTQKAVGDDTTFIRVQAPRTWQYLQEHSGALDRRASSIYRNRPRFAVFGVGDYSFSPWKVAISGFYKKLQFATVGSLMGKPIVLDDTGYFVACQDEEEACFLASLLNSEAAREFFSAFIFWDAKRPITVESLRRLDLSALARELRAERTMSRFLARAKSERLSRPPGLFDTD
jgi:hypothetical protein